MFNLPNNTQYVMIIEAKPGYMVMSCRWSSEEGSELGPVNTFQCYNTELEALAAVERFLDNETD